MPLVDDQKMIEAFTPYGADESFGERVGPWRPYRRPDHPGADVGEHAVERRGELRIAIADQEPERRSPLAQIHDQVACLLSNPRPARMTGTPEDVHASSVGFHYEEDIQPSQEHGVDVEEIARQQPVRLRAQELPPGQARAPRRRPQTRPRRASGAPCPPPPGIRAGPLRLESGG